MSENPRPPGDLGESSDLLRFPFKSLFADIVAYLGKWILVWLAFQLFYWQIRLLGPHWITEGIDWSLVVLLLFPSFLVHIVLRHFFRFYKLDEQGLHYRRGVLWRKHTVVPRNRIQHADLYEGLIQRGVGLATLRVHTAGVRSSTVSLPNLDDLEADLILRELVPDEDS